MIGSYLEGSMSPGEMLDFENQLHTDPVLRSEFELQQDIVNSVKDFRKSQLKARLDQVPVTMSPTILVGVKTAAALVISGIIGLGAYLYFTQDTPEDLTDNITIEEPVAALENNLEDSAVQNNNIEADSEATAIKDKVELAIAEEPAVEEVTANEVKVVAPIKTEEVTAEPEVKETTPVVNSPQIIDPSLDETVTEETLEMPSAAISQEEIADNPVVEVESAKKDPELFHYRYYSGKLYLYGDFKDIPYEILELNSDSGKKLYMYYHNKYYEILDNQIDLTPLQSLEDPDIIKRLDIIKENK